MRTIETYQKCERCDKRTLIAEQKWEPGEGISGTPETGGAVTLECFKEGHQEIAFDLCESCFSDVMRLLKMKPDRPAKVRPK